MFLIGGPAFSGTTLLALLLNQGGLLCLDEPDFHDPGQSHRGIPFLQELFPERVFPRPPRGSLTYEEATLLIRECEGAIHPYDLGIKTCDWPFLGYAEAYRRDSWPVICLVRDIRDALVRPLPEWVSEAGLNHRYRMIWERRALADLVVRYEDLVTDTEEVMTSVSAALRRPLSARLDWTPDRVHRHMLKLDRHELLKSGTISDSRVGVWRSSTRPITAETHETARMMGY